MRKLVAYIISLHKAVRWLEPSTSDAPLCGRAKIAKPNILSLFIIRRYCIKADCLLKIIQHISEFILSPRSEL